MIYDRVLLRAIIAT